MKKIQQFLDEGKIDIALALSMSLLEPKKTLAFNIILARCLSEFDFGRSSKVASFLGRELNNFELKIIFRGILSKRYPNLKVAEEVALKMTEPDKADALVIVFDYYVESIFNDHSHENGSKILVLINLMKEPERTKLLSKLLGLYLGKSSFFDCAKNVAAALGRELTRIEINNHFNLLFNELTVTERDNNYYPLYYEMKEMIDLLKRPDKAKSLNLLLGDCIKKNAIALILEISESLKEPEKTATLSIIFNYYLEKKEDKKALETANKMGEPQRSVNLQNFMENFIQDGACNSAKDVATIMGRKIEERELCRILRRMIDKGRHESALETISEIDNWYSRDCLLKRIFNGFIQKGYFGLALKAVKKVFSERDRFKLAETLFNQVIIADRWLSVIKEVANLMSEPEKSAALAKVSSRYINEAGSADLILLFGDKGLNEKEFKQFLKRPVHKEILLPYLFEYCSILNEAQKNIFLGFSASQAVKQRFYVDAYKIIDQMTGFEKENAAKDLRNRVISLGEFKMAKSLAEHWKNQLNDSEMNIILKKSIQEGWYEQAIELAELVGAKLTQRDLYTIMEKCLKSDHEELAKEVARKIIG